MSVDVLQPHTDTLQQQVAYHASELIALVRAKHPEARFHGPTYWSDEGLWVIEAFFDHGEDFELEDRLSERETDILLTEDMWFCVIPASLSLYSLPETHRGVPDAATPLAV
ncbi:MAG: hypothetical protein HY023_09855 [Chloroflexi bacterium]|nr:hypothetical protein [Chloroflexota bacterium]